MSETKLKDLLEDFDDALPNSLTRKKLLKLGHSKELIDNSRTNGVIHLIKSGKHQLTHFGLGLLLQLRIKGSIDKLDESIKKFESSSSEQSRDMITLTKKIFWLSVALYLIGLFQLIFLLCQIFKK